MCLTWSFTRFSDCIMFTRRSKIKKAKNVEPTPFEDTVCQVLERCSIFLHQALYDLQVNSDKLKGNLKEVHILAAKVCPPSRFPYI